jgi:hypothetical protein
MGSAGVPWLDDLDGVVIVKRIGAAKRIGDVDG